MAAPRKVDYALIEPEWRAGLKSVKQIAQEYEEKHGISISGPAITKHFNRMHIPRDLGARIREKAADLVLSATTPENVETDTEVVEYQATQVANVQLSHRKDINKTRSLVVELLEELQAVSGEKLTLRSLQKLIQEMQGTDEKSVKRAQDALERAISLPSRAGIVKALADSLKTVVGLEREAWGLVPNADREGKQPGTELAVFDSALLSRVERAELRGILERAQLRAQAPVSEQ